MRLLRSQSTQILHSIEVPGANFGLCSESLDVVLAQHLIEVELVVGIYRFVDIDFVVYEERVVLLLVEFIKDIAETQGFAFFDFEAHVIQNRKNKFDERVVSFVKQNDE